MKVADIYIKKLATDTLLMFSDGEIFDQWQ